MPIGDMRRAISVARLKSFEAPVVIWFMKSPAMRREEDRDVVQQVVAVGL
jgi:hypothetical protein